MGTWLIYTGFDYLQNETKQIERKLSVINLSSKNNFADVSIERSSRHQVRNNVAIYSHALPRIHVIGG